MVGSSGIGTEEHSRTFVSSPCVAIKLVKGRICFYEREKRETREGLTDDVCVT